jgi:predicted O-methyltransferase YrrM
VKLEKPLKEITESDHIPGWVDGRILARLRRLAQGKTVVNIGVWKGKSVAALAETAEKVYAVDHFRGSPDERETDHKQAAEDPLSVYEEFVAYLSYLRLWDKVVPMLCSSTHASGYFQDKSLDMAFIDGGHDYMSVWTDLFNWWQKIKPGGILCGDDGDWPGVRKALDEFSAVIMADVETDIDGKFWLLRLPEEGKQDVRK